MSDDSVTLDLIVNGIDNASGALGNITGSMNLGSIASGALAVAIGGLLKDALDSAGSAMEGFLSSAIQGENVTTALAFAWQKATDAANTNTGGTILSTDALGTLQDKLDQARAKLTDMTAAYDKHSGAATASAAATAIATQTTTLSAAALDSLGKQLNSATATLANMESAYASSTTHTTAQSTALEHQRQTVALLKDQISAGLVVTDAATSATKAHTAATNTNSASATLAIQTQKDAISALEAKLSQGMQTVQAVTVMSRDALDKLAISMRDLAGGDSLAVTSAEAVLLKFHTISAETFPGALNAAADLAVVMGTSMPAAAQFLGKVLEVPGMAMAKLKAQGVEVNAEFTKEIKTMEASGDTAGAQQKIIEALALAIGGKAASAASTLSGQWTILTGHMEEATRKIGDDFLPVLHNLFNTYIIPGANAVEGLANQFAKLFEGFKVGTVSGGIINFLADLEDMTHIHGLQQMVLEFSATLQNNLATAFTNVVTIGKGVVDFFVGNWPLIQKTGKVVWDSIIEILGAVGKEISTVVMPAVAALTGTIDLHLPKAQSVFETVMAVISEAMRGAVQVIETKVMPAVTKVVEWVVSHWPQIQATASQVFGAFGVVMTKAGEIFDSILGSMKGQGAIFKDVLTGNWSDIGVQLQRIWTANWKTIQLILTDALDLAKKAILAVDWHGIGISIMTGVQRGIEDGAYNAIKSMMNFGSDLKTAVKNAFGIWSPSSVFKDYGANLMQGLSLGITSNAHLPVTAAQNVAHSVSNTTQSTTVNNWNLTAQYAYQPERTLADTVRLLRAMS